VTGDKVATLPITLTATRMTVRTYSPDVGIQVRLKVEDAAEPTHSVEAIASTTVANAWETLTFDFATPAPGTAALNTGYTFNRMTIFFNFGVTGATVGVDKTYYCDDFTFLGAGSSGTGGGAGGGAGGGSGVSAPSAPPSAPTVAAGKVISLFSAAYTGGTAGGDYSAKVDSYNASCFGPPGNTVTNYTIPGTAHVVKQYTIAANSFGIIETLGASGGTASGGDSAICNGGTQTGANVIDITTMTGVHMDVWVAGGSPNFQVAVVGADSTGTIAGPGAANGATPGTSFASGANTIGSGVWVPVDLAISTFGPPGGPAGVNKLGLTKFFTVAGGTYYLDNVYFYKP
jgi:hypothetical protein